MKRFVSVFPSPLRGGVRGGGSAAQGVPFLPPPFIPPHKEEGVVVAAFNPADREL